MKSATCEVAPSPAHGDPRDDLVQHLPALRAYALSLTRNGAAADDLVQDTIVKAWTNIDKFQPGTNLRAWLMTVQRNTFYSDLRSMRNKERRALGAEKGEQFARPAHDGALAMRDFMRAFEELSAEHREVLTLIGALGMSYDEAADTIGARVGTVKSRVNRARLRLMEMLGLAKDETILPDPDPAMYGLTLPMSGEQGQ